MAQKVPFSYLAAAAGSGTTPFETERSAMCDLHPAGSKTSPAGFNEFVQMGAHHYKQIKCDLVLSFS
jgi:hypothetical protein